MDATQIEIALARKHTDDFFITECKNGPTWFGGHLRMDAVAIKKSWANPCVTAYEVKVSRGDFLRDSKWPKYLDYCNRLYFACPKGLITKADLPDPRVGLVWVNEEGGCYTAKAVPIRPTEIPAEFYQYILFSRLDSERIPFYRERADYARDYIEHRRAAKDLAHDFKSALIQRAAALERKIDEMDDTIAGKKAKQYDELVAVLKKHGIDGWWSSHDLPKRVEEVFSEVEREQNKIEFCDRILPLAKKIVEMAAPSEKPEEAQA